MLTCYICKGYLVDATTISECLHTFCRSCLVKFLLEKNTCPRCGNLIHQSHPLSYISYDKTIQDIVYKLVPNLQEMADEDKKNIEKKATEKEENKNYHRLDEQVTIILECQEINQLKSLKRKILQLSASATVTHIKKFVALKVLDSIDHYKDIYILCNDELLGKGHNLKFIIATRSKVVDRPLLLHYKRKLEL